MTLYAEDERTKQLAADETEKHVHQNKRKRTARSEAAESEKSKEADDS